MSLKDDITADVKSIFDTTWKERDGQVVPEDKDITLGNDAVNLDATVLYADMADSTKLVDGYKPWFAAEVYKTFLVASAKIIRNEGGFITAYDGDRVMALFIGKSKNSSAARTALKLNWAVKNIIQPVINEKYPKNPYGVRHVVGIDTSKLFVAKTGIRGANDLVWVGRAANYAAKLSALPHAFPTYITSEVHALLNDESKIGSNGKTMWEAARWETFDNRTIYQSTWTWAL